MKKAIVIGSGFSGLSAASYVARDGWEVTVVEKHGTQGGRARQLIAEGFTFDMGPSWYWMPDVFERYFRNFGKNVEDYYGLKRLDPSYRVYWHDDHTDVPANYQQLRSLFEQMEPGSGEKLDAFLSEAEFKYRTGMQKLVLKPGQSLNEFVDWDLIKGVLKLDVFTSMKAHLARFFKHPKLRFLLEFPVLFLGALPEHTPALYSLMNYADVKLGTWYPEGGMYSVVQGMYKLAQELGVKFLFSHNVENLYINNGKVTGLVAGSDTGKVVLDADVVIGSADYHFIEQQLLPPELRSYPESYWEKRVMAPSCLLYYVGVNKKLENLLHHSLFFDVPFDKHAAEIYTKPCWPENPLFYVSATSVTDETAAPDGCENLFFLIPVATGLTGDDESLRERYFEMILKRFEDRIGENVRDSIIFKKTFGPGDFIHEYNAFKGNAYGLANTLFQTAVLKPSCRSKKVRNLFYAGQLTVPGPGVPPSLISGEVVAKEVQKHYGKAVTLEMQR
ncbi:phytoene desaturase [Segetibacter sp. 3557_3]|uniref:phytoene desaturase family protein n=1 Tax=Segetibacter sp. 3557_3 TaxID=2547429 RepID=UPI00105887E5|nr:phytoene desaturase family protein [Segetibacter sp. 3557_3]TDH27407.1 phytoene desaturase [Segetibacter sp. 3557_3]